MVGNKVFDFVVRSSHLLNLNNANLSNYRFVAVLLFVKDLLFF